jgi:hypothetical protein
MQVLEALKEAGHLVADSNRWDKQIEVRPKRRERFYSIQDSILFTSDETVVCSSPTASSVL